MLNDRDDLGTPVAISTMAFEQCLWQDTTKCSRHDKAWQTTVTACRHRLKLGIAWDALFEHLESCTISYNLDDAVVIVAHGLRDALAITCTYWTQHDTTWHCPCILCVVFCASIFRELRFQVSAQMSPRTRSSWAVPRIGVHPEIWSTTSFVFSKKGFSWVLMVLVSNGFYFSWWGSRSPVLEEHSCNKTWWHSWNKMDKHQLDCVLCLEGPRGPGGRRRGPRTKKKFPGHLPRCRSACWECSKTSWWWCPSRSQKKACRPDLFRFGWPRSFKHSMIVSMFDPWS
jgi:hypothetical protein